MIQIFSKPDCIQCEQTKKFFDNNNVEYEVFDISVDTDAYDYVVSLGYSSAPVVIAEKTEFSGFQPDLLKTLISE